MKKKTVYLGLLFLLSLLIACPVSADLIIDESLSDFQIVASTATTTAGPAYTTCSDSFKFKIEHIEYYPTLNYISFVLNGNKLPSGISADGAYDFTYTGLSSTHSGKMYIARNYNLAGSVISTKYTLFFYDWDIGTSTGEKIITLSKTISLPSQYYGFSKPSVSGDIGIYLLTRGVNGMSPADNVYSTIQYSVTIVAVNYWNNHISVTDEDNTFQINLTREINSVKSTSTLDAGSWHNCGNKNVIWYLLPTEADSVSVKNIWGKIYEFSLTTDTQPTLDFTLALSPISAAVGDPITATLTNIPTDSNRLILNVNGVIHQDITNPYNFSAIGNSGETIYVFANCYDSSNNLLYSSNVVSYTLTGELEPIEPYPELEEVEITGVAPSYTQGNTLSASLDDNDIIGINEIWWKIIAQTDSNGNPSTITSKRYEFKEITSGNWQLKSGSSYTGSYTYANVKNLSHYIDGYGRFDVETNCYNSTNGLIAIDRVNSYANPASYIKPVSVYIYGNSGLYSGEITLTTEYIVQSKNTTYYIYNGYESINVVKAGDYNIYVDLTDNSIYKDKVLQYSYDSDGSILRIYLEEDYTISEHAKLSIRVVDSSGNPLSFANVHFIGLAESSMSTNANGYAEYIGINNETVKFTASKTGYISGEGSITLSDSINSFTLVLPTLTETITPTETSTSPDEDEGYNPFTNFITAIMEFGFNEESAKIVVALGLVGLLFACGVKFGESTGAGLAGAVIGVIFSALLSLIPMWVIMAIILCAATILATKFYVDR